MFTSGWDYPEIPQDGGVVQAVSNGRVYPFGLDPAWHGADNALIFTNSLKMKMSIIFGVIHVSDHGPVSNHQSHQVLTLLLDLQMSFAICLQVPNHLHFKNKRYIIAEFLPQILFMESIFGESRSLRSYHSACIDLYFARLSNVHDHLQVVC